jgi:iron complex transport system substrate-binding protein
MILAAGGTHPLQEEAVKSRPMTDEEVRDVCPDAFVIAWCGVPFEKYRAEVLLRNPLWQDLPAIREKRIFSISEAHMGRPSPRLIQGFQSLRAVVAAC